MFVRVWPVVIRRPIAFFFFSVLWLRIRSSPVLTVRGSAVEVSELALDWSSARDNGMSSYSISVRFDARCHRFFRARRGEVALAPATNWAEQTA